MGHPFQRARTKVLAGFLCIILAAAALPAQQTVTAESGIDRARLEGIRAVVEDAIRKKQTPGAVVLVGHRGQIVYRQAFGNREVEPKVVPMTTGTIFDMASLTKVMATTPAIMQLFEQGKIRLDDPVTAYWPEFGANGKEHITILELMTHYSGLPPDLDLKTPWSGYDHAMQMIVNEKPIVSRISR